jgi:glyoxylase-like metal-dependent hydrolase (beta-lactamase superfamily II)
MLQCNCSIVACPETREAIVVDPGGDANAIVDALEKNGLTVKYLLHTHAHFDHILGSKEMREKTGAKICLHKEDEWLYNNIAMQGSFVGFSFNKDTILPVDEYLQDEQEIKFGKLTAKVIHTPGHTPGSICFSMDGDEHLLFAGDTLFQESIGRTDLWKGSMDDILRSIKERLLTLDDETDVICGHGPNTTIFNERRHNPFVGKN